MNKKTIIALTLCAAVAAPSALYAEQAADPVSAEASAEETQNQGRLKSLGTATEGAFEVLLKNSTGKDIVKFRLRSSSDKDYGDSVLEDGDVYAADEERILYYNPDSSSEETPEETAAPAETGGEDKALPDAYDIEVTFKPETEGSEGAVYELHSFPFGDIMEGEIHLEGEVLYLEYKSIKTDESISTKAYEEGILTQKAAEQAAAEQADAGQAVAEVAAPVYQDYSQDYSYQDQSYDYGYDNNNYSYDYSYTEPSYSEPAYSEPAYSEPSYDNGGGDQCIEDGLIYE